MGGIFVFETQQLGRVILKHELNRKQHLFCVVDGAPMPICSSMIKGLIRSQVFCPVARFFQEFLEVKRLKRVLQDEQYHAI